MTMKYKKILFKILITTSIFNIHHVSAMHTYINRDLTTQKSSLIIDTTYEAAPYYPKESKLYAIDLSWDDFHISYINNDSNISNTSNKQIINNTLLLSIHNNWQETLYNENVLSSNYNIQLDNINMILKNKSGFAINIEGIINTNDKYINDNNYIKLQLANCNINCEEKELYFKNKDNITNLLNKEVGKFIIKPAIKNTQNFNSDTTIVTDNIKLIITKN